jgi:two-component system NarL family sensor kinase
VLAALDPTLSACQTLSADASDSARSYLYNGETKPARKWTMSALATASTSKDSARALALLGLINDEEGYLVKARNAYMEAYHKSKTANATEELAASLAGLAAVSTTTGQYDSVLTYLQRGRELDTTPAYLLRSFQVEGRYWQTQNQYDTALSVLQRALDIATRTNDRRNIAITLSSIGSIYFSHNPDMSHALRFFERSVSYCDSARDAAILARNYGRMANSYMVLGDGPNAESYLMRARRIVEITDNLPVRAYVLSSWATYLHEQGKYREAISFLEEPVRIRRQLEQKRSLQNDLLNISESYMMLRMHDQAQAALNEGVEISKSLHDIIYLKYFYDRLASLDSVRGNFKSAYSNLKRSMAYKDSTFSAQHLRDVREIQEKYEAEQNQKLLAEKELEIEQQKYKQALLAGIFVSAVLAFAIMILVVRARGKLKLQQQAERQNQLRLQTVVQTQEEVQQRIARDLHDGLVQVLGAAKMSLQSVGPNTDPMKHIHRASEIIDEAVSEARSISHEILPYSLMKDGLVPALEDLFARSLSSYSFEHDLNGVAISEQKSINTYRIAQELVNNVQKHAHADAVRVSLSVAGGQLVFAFSDNGAGFDTTRLYNGAGMSNVAARAAVMEGKISVESTIGKGTIIADDHRLMLAGLASLIESIDGLELAGKFSSGKELVETLNKTVHVPDICIVDIEMPGMDGVETVKKIRQTHPRMKIMALTMHNEWHFVNRMIAAGANGYLLKNVERDVFTASIEKVLNGQAFVTEGFLSTPKASDEPLSEREREVLMHIAAGRSNKEIAEALFISARTADTHRTNIKRKLKLSTLSQLVEYAKSQGII